MAFATTTEDSAPVSGTSQSKTRHVAVPIALTALGLALVLCLGLLLWQRSDLHQVRADLASANRANTVNDARVADLKKNLQSLDAQVHALQGQGGASTDSLAGMRTTLTALDGRLKKDEDRLKYICDKSAVQSQESNIWGQQSADPNTDYNYYDNLVSVIEAVCGSPVSPTN